MAKELRPDVLPIVTDNAVYTPHVRLLTPFYVILLLKRATLKPKAFVADPDLQHQVRSSARTRRSGRFCQDHVPTRRTTRCLFLMKDREPCLDSYQSKEQVSDAQTEMRRGLCYIKGETNLSQAEKFHTSGLKPITMWNEGKDDPTGKDKMWCFMRRGRFVLEVKFALT